MVCWTPRARLPRKSTPSASSASRCVAGSRCSVWGNPPPWKSRPSAACSPGRAMRSRVSTHGTSWAGPANPRWPPPSEVCWSNRPTPPPAARRLRPLRGVSRGWMPLRASCKPCRKRIWRSASPRVLPNWRRKAVSRCRKLDHRAEEDFHEARKALKAWTGALGFLHEGTVKVEPILHELAELLGDENDLATLSALAGGTWFHQTLRSGSVAGDFRFAPPPAAQGDQGRGTPSPVIKDLSGALQGTCEISGRFPVWQGCTPGILDYAGCVAAPASSSIQSAPCPNPPISAAVTSVPWAAIAI